VFHRFLRPQAGLRSGADRVAEHVTYRDVRHDQELGQLHALGAFSRALTPQHHHAQAEQHRCHEMMLAVRRLMNHRDLR
jgi:hypothetical protein